MSKETSHAHEINPLLEKGIFHESMKSLKASLPMQPVLAFLESFDHFFKKKKQDIAKGEVLFSPGENPYFYIVASGALAIFRITPTGEKKEIGRAYKGSFLGEGVLFGRTQKDTEAIAHGDGTSVIALTKEEITLLESENPKKLLELYKYIVEVTNSRLLEVGKELAMTYEMTEKINTLSKSGELGFRDIIDYVTKSLTVDYIIYAEKHPIVQDLIIYKYNSRFPSVKAVNQKAGTEISPKSEEGFISNPGDILGTGENDFVYNLPLKTRENLKGFLLIGTKDQKDLADVDLRIFHNISPLLASIIENNQTLADKKAVSMRQ